MQVNRGIYRGLKLDTLDANTTRPTSSKVKEAIFSMLENNIYDARVLDLFSGSGALGIEAISSHASFVCFNDQDKAANKIIQTNLNKLKNNKNYQLSQLDYQKCLTKLSEQKDCFDIIFLDPPYHLDLIDSCLNNIINNNLITKDGIIVCESSLKEIIPDNVNDFIKVKDKKYGTIKISIFRRQ